MKNYFFTHNKLKEILSQAFISGYESPMDLMEQEVLSMIDSLPAYAEKLDSYHSNHDYSYNNQKEIVFNSDDLLREFNSL